MSSMVEKHPFDELHEKLLNRELCLQYQQSMSTPNCKSYWSVSVILKRREFETTFAKAMDECLNADLQYK